MLFLCQDRIQTCGMSSSNRNSHTPPPSPVSPETAGLAGDGLKSSGLIASAPVGEPAVFSADLKGNITSCNFAATTILGYEAHEILGKNLSAIFSANHDTGRGKRTSSFVDSAVASEHYESRAVCRSKSDKDVVGRLAATLLRDVRSAPAVLVCFFTPGAEAHQASATSPGSEGNEKSRI